MSWNKTVKFRDLLDEYDTSKDELEEIKRVKPLQIERFKQYSELEEFIAPLKRVKTQTQFNKWLNNVYDYCDICRIWVDL